MQDGGTKSTGGCNHPEASCVTNSPDLSDDEGPEWEPLLACLEAAHGVVDDEHLVDVEGDAQDVAQEEHPHQAHEHHSQVVLLPTPSLNERIGQGVIHKGRPH